MFQRILLAWDGSPPAKRALDVAIDLARRYEAEIVAVSVAHSPPGAETEADRVESVGAAEAYLTESLTSVSDRAQRVGVFLEHVIIAADEPVRALVDYGHEHGVDLVVVGHHRQRRAGRFLLHGVAEPLVDAGTIPVLVVNEVDGA